MYMFFLSIFVIFFIETKWNIIHTLFILYMLKKIHIRIVWNIHFIIVFLYIVNSNSQLYLYVIYIIVVLLHYAIITALGSYGKFHCNLILHLESYFFFINLVYTCAEICSVRIPFSLILLEFLIQTPLLYLKIELL